MQEKPQIPYLVKTNVVVGVVYVVVAVVVEVAVIVLVDVTVDCINVEQKELARASNFEADIYCNTLSTLLQSKNSYQRS